MWIDSHTHLDFAVFDPLSPYLQAAQAAQVEACVLAGVQASRWPPLYQLARTSPYPLAPSLGLHPYFLDAHQPDADLAQLQQTLQRQHPNKPWIAIGEFGLDPYCAPLAAQWPLFEAQVQLARAHQLPVILHVRQVHDVVCQYLRRYPVCGGVIHAFSGSLQQAHAYLDLGLRLGIGGALTYPRAQKLRRVMAAIPADAFVLETDSPDMPLCGYQGQTNQPARLPIIAQHLAKLRQLDLTELSVQARQNTLAALPLLAIYLR
ncbi:TatD DNase family protein [Allopseudospirillum japonicum]|uniref:TatD DNase family protein n=1 Tax=Allopseudospirillum japonicum TaxID=64971 RepID=A0A1H6SN44_9GAMM|nr:TatD family hydrolase [Allopseudospirillum japonicum]SEI67324.1 TatD DNase family protein [Allopseudospirillum japonicum]